MNKQTRIFSLTRFELSLWLLSLAVMLVGYALVPDTGLLSFAASLIGVTALIFVAKGAVIGQILTVVFAVFYGIISFRLRYYGEMITYLCMSAPIAAFSVISWLRHPYAEDGSEVRITRLGRSAAVLTVLLSLAVSVLFYFILRALGNAELLVSTFSVTTSFLAAFLLFLRSPWYALAYAANDVVLIVLWVIAAMDDLSYLSMVACFVMFLCNDLYGFFNWLKLRKKQDAGL